MFYYVNNEVIHTEISDDRNLARQLSDHQVSVVTISNVPSTHDHVFLEKFLGSFFLLVCTTNKLFAASFPRQV